MHVDAEGRLALLIGQPQKVGHAAHRSALHQQRNDRPQENHVEQQPGILHMRHQRIDGEEDRHGAAQPDPRHVKPRLGRKLAEREQAGEDRQRTRHKDHERPDQPAEDQHPGFEQFVAVHEQAQREEHHDLHEPREPVEEDGQRPFLFEFMVADNQTRKVDGQVAVTLDQVGEGEREEDECQQEHRVERMVGQLDAVDRPYGQPPDQVPGQGAHDHLHHEKDYAHAQADAGRGIRHDADEQDGHHVCHRVVRTALQLQQRAQVLLEPLFLASQDGENRRRVGRGHRGGQQQCQRERYFDPQPRSHQPHETGQHERRHDHADRSQYDARADDGFYLRELRVHTAREEDNTQGDHTHELGHLDRTVRDEIQTEQHAHPEEQQQRGGPETIRDLTGHHRHEEQQCAYQYYVFTTDVYHSSPFMLRYALSTMFSLVSGLYSRSAYSNACMAAKLLSGVR